MSTPPSNSSASSTGIKLMSVSFGNGMLDLCPKTGLTYDKKTIPLTVTDVTIKSVIVRDPDAGGDPDASEPRIYNDAQENLRLHRNANSRDMSSLLMIRICYMEDCREKTLDLVKMLSLSGDLSEERTVLAAIRKLFNSY